MDVLPAKPGLGVFNYFVTYNGSVSANRPFPIAGEIALNVDATSYADSVGAFWVTPLKVLGANYVLGVALPFVSNEVSAQVTGPRGRSVQRSETASGLGDIECWSVALSWTVLNKDLHVNFFGGIYAPTGDFQANQLAKQRLGLLDLRAGLVSQLSKPEERLRSRRLHRLRHQHQEHRDGLPKRTTVPHRCDPGQHLPLGKGLIGIGANGFYVKQTTGDSGSGARLGSFEEMSTGVGRTGALVCRAVRQGGFCRGSEVAAADRHSEHTQR